MHSNDPEYAKSFEEFDDNILADDNDNNMDHFAPIHYDQRFSTNKYNELQKHNSMHNAMQPIKKHQVPIIIDDDEDPKYAHSNRSKSNSKKKKARGRSTRSNT